MPGEWSDEEARSWLASDAFGKTLDLPRKIAAAVVGQNSEVRKVIDIASGPGTFLRVFLDAFPSAHGVWHDASQVMEDQARKSLLRYGERVSFVKGDITSLGNSNLDPDLDVVLTSRATHHLTVPELQIFYAQAFNLLKPGGWLVNIDHVLLPEPWDDRIRKTRRLFAPKTEANESGHKHEGKAPYLYDHFSAINDADIKEVHVVWQAFYTVLILAHKQSN